MKPLFLPLALALSFALTAPAARAANPAPNAAVTGDREAAPALDARLIVGHPGLLDGSFDAVSADLMAALEADPTAPLAHAAVQALFDLNGLRSQPLDLERVRALRDAVVDGRAKDGLARLERLETARRAFGDDAATARGRGDLDEVENWFLLGPLGPLDRIEPLWGPLPDTGPARTFERSVASDFGTQLEWIPAAAEDGWVHVDERIRPATGGELFFATFIDVDIASGVLVLEADFPLQAFWNGELVLDARQRGLTDTASRHEIDVRFTPDEHDALVVRCDNGYSDALRARVLAADGSVYAGTVRSIDHIDAVPSAYPTYRAADPVGRRAAPSSDAGFDTVLDLFIARRDGRYDEALTVPEPTDIEALGAWLYQRYFALTNAIHLPSEVQRRLLVQVEGRLADLGLDVPEIRQWRARRHLEEDRAAEALDAARTLVERHPGVPAFRMLERGALAEVDPTGVLELVAARGAGPDDADALDRLADWALGRNDFAGALDLYRRAARLDGRPDSGYARSVMDILAGGTDAQQRELFDWIEHYRAGVREADWLKDYEARAHLRLGDAQPLEALLRERLAHAPRSASRHAELGDFLLERGRDDEALAAYREAARLAPDDRALRRVLDTLGERDPAEAFFEAFAVDGSEELAAARALETTASTSLALDVRMDYVRPDGSYRSRIHLVTVAHDRAGTEQLHESSVAGEPRVARVVQSDGSTAEPVAVEGSWVMPTLDPGDAVELVFDENVAGTPGVAPRLPLWRFESFEQPYQRSRLVMFLPENVPGRLELHDFDGTHEEIPWEGGTVHVLELRESPRLDEEPARPADMNLLTWATYGDDLVLAHVAEEERRSASWAAWLAADVEIELRELARDVAAGLPVEQRPQALYDAVSEHVLDFSGDGDTTDVWTLRRGRPIGLYAALLGLAGVPYEWALPHPLFPERLDPVDVDPFVSYDDFGDWMLRIAPASGATEPTWVLMPAGGRGLPLGRLPSDLAGAQVLVLGSDEHRFERLPRGERPPTSETTIVVHLADDKSARIEGRVILRDVLGPLTREAIGQAEPQQRAPIAQQIASQAISGLELADSEFVDLDVRGADFELRFEGTVDRFVRGTSRSPYCSAVVQPIRFSRAIGSADRTWPFELLTTQSELTTVTIHPSPGYELPANARSARVDEHGLLFDLRWTPNDDGSLTIERRFAIDGVRVAPEDVGRLLVQLAQVEDLDGDRIELEPTEGD